MSLCTVFADRFPFSCMATLCLLRCRVRLSRELTDDVVRARGRVVRGYYTTNGPLCNRVAYFDDKMHGREQWWNKNGALYIDGTWINGGRHGLFRWWYYDRTLAFETQYYNGRMHGFDRTWNNDVCIIETRYHHGEQVC